MNTSYYYLKPVKEGGISIEAMKTLQLKLMHPICEILG
jgi:hypothetical protein